MNKVSVDQNLCIGCGLCESTCPEIFSIDQSDFKARLKDGANLGDCSEKAREAEENCPVKAIKVS